MAKCKTGTHKATKAQVDKMLAELKKQHGPDLTGQSPVVCDRFEEVDEIADNNEDYIMLLDGLEKALVGTAEVNGTVVAVYEEELCIKCIMDNYGDKWYEGLGYSDDEINDAGFMEAELYRSAREDYEYNTVRSLPYQHEHAPMIIKGFMVDVDRWENFRTA